jgi:hypothetical protein
MSCKKISQLPQNQWCEGIILLGEQYWELVKVPLDAACFWEWAGNFPCEITCETFTINGDLDVNGVANTTTLNTNALNATWTVALSWPVNISGQSTFSNNVFFGWGVVDFSWTTVVGLGGAWLGDWLFNNITTNTLTVVWVTNLDNTTVDGTFDATWDVTVGGDSTLGGDLDIAWELTVNNNAEVTGDFTVWGTTNLANTTVCGDLNFCPGSNLDLSNANVTLPTALVWQATQTTAGTTQLWTFDQVYKAEHVSTTSAWLTSRPTLIWQAVARQHYTYLGHLGTGSWTGNVVGRLPSNILASTLWLWLVSGLSEWAKVSLLHQGSNFTDPSTPFTLSIVDENDLNEFWPFPVRLSNGSVATLLNWEYAEFFFNHVTNTWIKLGTPPTKYYEEFWAISAWTKTFTHNFGIPARVADLEVISFVSPSKVSRSNGRAADKWNGLVGIGTGMYIDELYSIQSIGTRLWRVRNNFSAEWWDIAITSETANTLVVTCTDIGGTITANWFIRIST